VNQKNVRVFLAQTIRIVSIRDCKTGKVCFEKHRIHGVQLTLKHRSQHNQTIVGAGWVGVMAINLVNVLI
jgi:hypothetical protein